jgi:hypothetical protein
MTDMSNYEVNALVHMNVTKIVPAASEEDAKQILVDSYHRAFGDDVALVDVQHVLEIHTPDMGWLDCRYVYEGNDPEDGDYYRCLTHDALGEALTLGHQVSCEKASEGRE